MILDRNTWNHIIVYESLMFDRNTWKHIIVYKLLILDWDTWNHIIVYELLILYRDTWYHIPMQTKDYFCWQKKNWNLKDFRGMLKIKIVMITVKHLQMNKISELIIIKLC